ncbi:MAG: DUF5763 domain-containing protein [Bacteroidota bacterium]|jgi:hypothetical protein
MKIPFAIFLSLLFCSCDQTGRKTDELNRRVTRLEQRMDSLTNTKTGISGDYTNKGTITENSRCRGITKKRTQCKRKAKTNGYCWQHGG